MNDQELLTLVRESFTGVHTTTPLEQIVPRGRSVRARRRIPALTAALAVVAGAAVAVAMLLPGRQPPGSQPPGHRSTVQLAAWTVTRQADGSIKVTIRELRDPAGLQARLRADGVPASVTLIGHQNPACRRDPVSGALMHRVFSHSFIYIVPPRQGPPAGTPSAGNPPQVGLVLVMVIRPSALPSGTGVRLATSFALFSPAPGHMVARTHVEHDLVYASPQCTG
ncbi:MAG TPA: hypothetical protein VIX86_21505 [Streptosporangiaceae bacterium]